MRDKLQQMRAPLAECCVAFFHGQRVQFNVPVDHPGQDKFRHTPEEPLNRPRLVEQFLKFLKRQVFEFAVGQASEETGGRDLERKRFGDGAHIGRIRECNHMGFAAGIEVRHLYSAFYKVQLALDLPRACQEVAFFKGFGFQFARQQLVILRADRVKLVKVSVALHGYPRTGS